MSPSKRMFLAWWIGGLVTFGIAIYFHAPLITSGVPGGIIEHQAAPDAATVNAIHDAWKAAGAFDHAGLAIFSDLVFIQIYSFGAFLGGSYFFAKQDKVLRVIGGVVMFAAGVFFIADNGETISQLIQVLQDQGSDSLAGVASTLQGPKSISFVVTFIGLAIALVVEPLRP